MRPDRPRLSFLRVLGTLVLAGGIAAIAATFGPRIVASVGAAPERGQPWYAPYVDATLTPTYPFEDRNANPRNDVVLGFIVASRDGACVPTWGTFYDLPGAGSALDLDRRIDRLRQRGGDLIVSFGGAANDELALHCDSRQLQAAYTQVIDRYHPRTIDFDIEGTALADNDANMRRAVAVRALQKKAAAAHKSLAVWLTLPVAPDGMTTEAVATIDSMLQQHVNLAGVNLLTMDYSTLPENQTMVSASESAVTAAWRQLDGAYRRAGTVLPADAVWRRLGMTPMIGQNDVPSNQVSVSDAKQLLAFARTKHLGRISIWSLNRDQACGAQLDLGTLSNLCSGVQQEPLAFTGVFEQLPSRSAPPLSISMKRVTSQAPDDPAHSPYPIWSDAQVYKVGAKVTWHHNVYQAKWFSHANVPDAPVVHEWETPWRYLGPVLPGDHPPPPLPKGTYPAWQRDKIYLKGDRVEVDGVGYEARWWTHGDPPNLSSDPQTDSPWEELPRAGAVSKGTAAGA
jgi:chitinase